MTIRVLIVDDSAFICKRIREILEQEPGFKVVGVASNGKEAIIMAAQLEPDVITMDVEMPIMDGISAVKQIMRDCPTGILMFSAATHTGAKATLDALNAGAIDFLPKQLDEIDANREMAKQLLRSRVRIVSLQTKRVRRQVIDQAVAKRKETRVNNVVSHYPPSVTQQIDLLVIVASTGGPVAIQKILPKLSSNCAFPVLIVQHMPANFTNSFAERLNQLCSVSVKQAANGDVLNSGEVFVAPGGMQMELNSYGGQRKILIKKKQSGEIYSPCADTTLTSIANFFSGNVLTVVLTGMGSDGKEGVRKLKQKKMTVWAQDEASCVIYGMPKAIVDENLADAVLSLDEIAKGLSAMN